MDPKKLLQEIIVDEIIRNKLETIKESVSKYSDEQQIRKVVRNSLKNKKLVSESVDNLMKKLLKEDIDKIPYNSTAMNVLKDLLKKVIPILESTYKMLTSDREQRKSFEAHIIVGIKNSIGTAKLSRDADTNLSDSITGSDIKQYIGNDVAPEVDDALNAYDEAVPQQQPQIEPELDQNAAKEIGTIKELASSLNNELKNIYKRMLLEKRILQEAAGSIDFNKFAPKEQKPVDKNEQPKQENPAFLDINDKKPEVNEPEEPDKMGGLDSTKYNETGRNLAIDAFSKVEKSIVAAYNLLADAEDRKIFYIYLIANIVMHFRRFEDELNSALQSSEVVPQQAQDKVDQASAQPSEDIANAVGKQPAKNISEPTKPAIPSGGTGGSLPNIR